MQFSCPPGACCSEPSAGPVHLPCLLYPLASAGLLEWLSVLTRRRNFTLHYIPSGTPTARRPTLLWELVGQSSTRSWETGQPACSKNLADHILPFARFFTGNKAQGGKRRPARVSQTLCREASHHLSAFSPGTTSCFHPVGT